MNTLIAVPSPIIGALITRCLRVTLELSQIGEANDEQEAYQQLPLTEWQLIILGLGLGPTAGGSMRLLERIRADYPRVPVVMVSHYDYHAAIRQCLARGVFGFVLHSELAEELLPSVRAALAGQVYLSAALTQHLNATEDDKGAGAASEWSIMKSLRE